MSGDIRPIVAWLTSVCVLIALLISIGGYTRLTNSGLSIVEWAPVSGIIPPLDETQWQNEFEAYQQFPEFKIANPDMTLAGFKRIFWIEYLHRAIARFIAFVFFVPLMYFLLRRRLNKSLAYRLGVVFLLGGVQGAMGWYMVQSGLADNPAVSQYRLTAHLGLAVLIYGYLVWLITGLLMNARQYHPSATLSNKLAVIACLVMIAVMQVSGGFMAGTHAGFAFNTFPDMNGELVPAELLALQPLWRNLFENVTAIQFFHRWLAVVMLLAVVWLWCNRFKFSSKNMRLLHDVALAVVVVQYLLGVSTLLSVVSIPIALTHQMGFVSLVTVLIVLLRLTFDVQYQSTAG